MPRNIVQHKTRKKQVMLMTGVQMLPQVANHHLVVWALSQSQFPPLGGQTLCSLLPIGWMSSHQAHCETHHVDAGHVWSCICCSLAENMVDPIIWRGSCLSASSGRAPMTTQDGLSPYRSLWFLQSLMGVFAVGWWYSPPVSALKVQLGSGLSAGAVAVGFDCPMPLVVLNPPLTGPSCWYLKMIGVLCYAGVQPWISFIDGCTTAYSWLSACGCPNAHGWLSSWTFQFFSSKRAAATNAHQ